MCARGLQTSRLVLALALRASRRRLAARPALELSSPAPSGGPIETGNVRPQLADPGLFAARADLRPRRRSSAGAPRGARVGRARLGGRDRGARRSPRRTPTSRPAHTISTSCRGVAEGAVTVPGARDPRARFDRASAYTLFDASLALGDACREDTAVAASVARASLFRVAPATDEGSARAEAAYVARLAVPCAMARLDGIDAFQQRPGTRLRGPVRRGRRAGGRGVQPRRVALLLVARRELQRHARRARPRPLGALADIDAARRRTMERRAGRDRRPSRELQGRRSRAGRGSRTVLAEFGTTRALLGPRDNGVELAGGPSARGRARAAHRLDDRLADDAAPARVSRRRSRRPARSTCSFTTRGPPPARACGSRPPGSSTPRSAGPS